MKSQAPIPLPLIDTSKTKEGLARVQTQIDDIRRNIQKRLEDGLSKVNQTPVFEGGGFFCKRDIATVEVILQVQREAFFAGFKRSDYPPPSSERIEAAFEAWMSK